MFSSAQYANPSHKYCKLQWVIYYIRDIGLPWKWWTQFGQTHNLTLGDRHKSFMTYGRITVWKLKTFVTAHFFMTKYPILFFNSAEFLLLFCIINLCTRSPSLTQNKGSSFLQEVDCYLQNYVVLYPRWPCSELSLMWRPQIGDICFSRWCHKQS
jgi:hypothetical protein